MPARPRRSRSITLATLLLLGTGVSAVAGTSPPVVRLDSGPVAGSVEGASLVFKGIPYAAPPVGALRWRAPQPVAHWTATRAADRFGAICMQPSPKTAESEDCLFLNVFRPAGKARHLPVLFWIPGGGLVAGAGSEPVYDGKALAAKGVVVVTINYRVGRFGFFAHPQLSAANADGGRLYNYGLMDETAALQWVRRNIAAFGGDPAQVTIFGQSAGGASVDALMIAPEARGLFAAAISESGYGRGSYPRIATRSATGDAPAESIGTTLAARLGIPNASIDDLRAVAPERIIALFDSNEFHIFAVDGKTLTSDLWPAFARNEEAPVPFIIGSASYEMGPMPAEDQRPWAEKVVPADRWSQLLPVYDSADQRDHLLLSDVLYTSQARALARGHAANGHPTYLYRFDVPSTYNNVLLPGALHAAELPYVFGNLEARRTEAAITAQDRRVSAEMMGYWTNFAARQDPNGQGVDPWQRYDGHALLMIRPDAATMVRDPLEHRLGTIDSLAVDILPETPQP